jgi:hypothetical protein
MFTILIVVVAPTDRLYFFKDKAGGYRSFIFEAWGGKFSHKICHHVGDNVYGEWRFRQLDI